jgi:hypothetical protein
MPKENQTKENKTAFRNRVRGALLGMDSKPGKERCAQLLASLRYA